MRNNSLTSALLVLSLLNLPQGRSLSNNASEVSNTSDETNKMQNKLDAYLAGQQVQGQVVDDA